MVQNEEIKQVVREAMTEILTEHRPMPVPVVPPSNYMAEIIIRVGPATVFQVQPGPVPLCVCPCLGGDVIILSEETEALLGQIAERTKTSREDLLHQLNSEAKSRQLEAEIQRLAHELGVE